MSDKDKTTANDPINLTGRDNYLMRQALKLTDASANPTHAEITRALLDAADLLEAELNPPWGNINDMRTLVRERFMPSALSELSAREKRRAIKLHRGE